MIVDFKSIKHDFYGIVEQPVLTLKTPHGTVISTITYISPKLKLRYNDVSEVEFSVPAYNNGEKINNYDEILGDRLVEVEPFGDFILVNPEIENEGGIKEVKKCKAYSKEYALNYKRLNIPAGTYNFYNPVDNENTITTMILEVLPDWTFGDIDSELIGRWRTFENTEDNLYSFMMNTLQETYNCLFLFDTFNKEINVISANRSMPSLPIYLSYNNLLKTVNVTELSDEVITVLSGYGSGDKVDIRSANPNGTNKIYNLDYYISRGDLPDDLTDKWLSYRDMVDLYQDVFSNFNVLYNQKNAELIAGQASLIEAKTEYDAINTTYLTAQTNENPDMEAIANLESELEKAKTKVETCQTLVDEVLKPDLNEIIKQRQDIVKLCKLDSNFSKDEIKILSQYFKEDSITEDTFVIPEYSASSSANISSRIQDSSEAKIKIIGSQIYASNIAEIFDMDTDGFYKSTYTDPDTGEEQYFTSNIDAFEGMEMPSTIENTVVDQLNENLKRKMYEFRGGIFELNFKSEIASEGKLFEKDQYIKGDVVNVDFSYNTDNLDAYVDENSPDTTKARGFIVCANLRNADYSGTSYPSMNITLQGMIRKEVPQVGTDFLSFDIESAIFSCTGSVTEYQKQNVIQELYDYTKDSLIKLAYPSYEFSVESGNFIFAKDFEPFKDKLELGCRINLMLDDEEENLLQPILIEIDLNYDDDSDFSIVFSNKFNSNDSEFKLADLITENTRSSRSVSLNKGSYNAYKDNNTKAQIDNLTYGALDVAKNKIINSANQAVEWNSSGLFLRKYAANGGYEDRQVGLISDTIAFTKDNWKTVDIAIGALDDPNTGSGYGIIAPSIFGTLLCGKNLVIDNPVYKDDGTTISKQFKVDSTGAWLNNSSFVLSQDASEDFAGGKIIIDPRYGIAAGNLNLFTLGDSEGNNGTEIHPSFMDDDGNIIFDETKLIETSEGSIPYVPKNTTFFFNIRTGDAYFGGDINAENIIAGTFNGEVIKPGSIGGDAIANDAINSEHISSIDADSVTISNLSSDNFTGGKIVADSVTTEGLSANVIEAINASIGKIDADKIVSGSVQAGELIIDGENGKLAILPEYGIIAGNSNIFTIVDGEIIPSFKDDNGELIIDENTGAPLNSSFYFDINTGKAYFAGSINASQITSGTISADIIKGSVIEAINLSAGQINADRVNITDGYITNAMIDNLDAGKIKTGTLDASLATIVNLDASNITTGLLNAEYIDTDSISAEFANTVVSHIGEAQIHSAMIKDLTFDKITGFDVNTTNLTIHSEDGKSQWYDNTIQISDANRVRVQIGKDASNDYSMYVWDATGNLMFDALGLTDSGIQREIIRNDMVAEDAAINGSKLDIESVFREMDGSTYTLTSNHLTYDGKSLDLTLQSMSETDKEQGQLLSSQGTQITAIQGQIASKIWQQDIDTATGEMNTKYSELEQELDGFKTTVGETYSTKAEAEVLAEAARNAQKTAEDAQTDLDNAKANLADVTSRVDATEEDIAAAQKAVDDAQTAVDNAQKAAVAAKKAADQAQSDVNALTKRVENAETSISQNTEQISLRATKSEVTTAKDEALNESKSYTDAQIKVSADGITSSVSKTYATKEALSAAETRITQTENNISSQVSETDGLKERVSTVEQTADGLEVRLTAAESGNLIKNGYGELLDNTNFSGGTFTRGDCPSGCYGYFNDGTTDLIPFNPNRIYEYNYFVRLHNGSSGSNYFSIQPFDIDGNLIAIAHVPWYNSNLFYLSEDLKDGDTVVHFTDLTNWRTDTTQTYQRSFLIFNYTDSTGYTYPPGTYSRNYYSDIYEDNTSVDLVNNTITLKEAWNKGTIAAGTCISQTSAGSTYCYYGQTGSITNTEWKNYNGTIYAGDVGGSINENTLRLLYAKKIRISLYNNVADYAGLYLGEKIIDQEARRTATNFLSYDDKNGLLVGNKTSGEWSGCRSQMLPTAFNILDADGNTLSSFGANDIELGKNNRNASINLCDGLGIIRTEDADDTLYKRMIISTDDATSKPTLIDLKTKNVTCGGMWSNNKGETFESRLYVNTLKPWSTSSADATPYISLVSRMFKTTGIYNDGVISNIRVDGDSEYGYIRIQTNSEVSTDERYISTDPVGVKFSPQRRTADTYNFTGGNIEFYGGTVTVNGTAVSLDGHKHNALYHTSSGNLCLTCIQDSDTYYVRKGSSMSDINVCSGSNTYPWYNVYTENLRVSGGKPVFTYVGSNGGGSTVSYATNMYVGSTGTVSRTTNTSSRTIKHDITELQDEQIKAENLYNVNVYQAKYNEDILSSNDPRYSKDLPMFIIEDLDEKYPIAVDKPSENVKEWSWNAQYLIPPMLKLIQMQYQTDIDLENKIKDLELKLDKALEIINNLTNN